MQVPPTSGSSSAYPPVPPVNPEIKQQVGQINTNLQEAGAAVQYMVNAIDGKDAPIPGTNETTGTHPRGQLPEGMLKEFTNYIHNRMTVINQSCETLQALVKNDAPMQQALMPLAQSLEQAQMNMGKILTILESPHPSAPNPPSFPGQEPSGNRMLDMASALKHGPALNEIESSIESSKSLLNLWGVKA